MDQPAVAAIVLNWESYDDTLSCVQSLLSQDYSNLNILVVDNGSKDGSGNRLAAELDIPVVKLTENAGFGEGMNQGVGHLESRDADYLWFLNNDIEFEPDTLSKLIEAFMAESDIKAVSPHIRKMGHDSHQSSSDSSWFERGTVDLDNGIIGHTDLPKDHPRFVDSGYVPFTAVLVDSEAYNTLGGLPSEYFLYYEDVDFCTRANKLGKVVVDTETVVDHNVSSSSKEGGASPTKAYYRTRNHFIFMRKIGKRNSLYQPNLHLRILKEFGEHLLNGETNCLRAITRGLADGIRGATGKGPYP